MNATAWDITFDITTAAGFSEQGALVVFGFTLQGALQGFETVRQISCRNSGAVWNITAARKLSGSEMLDLI